MNQIDLEKLRSIREEKGFTQGDVSKYLGYKSPQGYHYLEKGRCQIKATQLTALCSLYGVPIHEFCSMGADHDD